MIPPAANPAPSNGFREALIVVSLALVPLVIEPFRLEGFETQRAPIIGLLVVLALLFATRGRKAIPGTSRLPLLALLSWIVALAAASLFSLSPLRSITGDLLRHMGLLTQLALLAAVYLGATLRGQERLWRWLWITGVVGSAYVILEATGLLLHSSASGRPPGPMGSATFTAGWLALVMVWVGFSLVRPRRSWASLRDWLGLALMLVAFLLTGSRGPMIALGAGLVTGLLCRRAAVARIRLWLTRAILLTCFAFILISGLDLNSGILKPFHLNSIVNALEFRGSLWWDAAPIVLHWPVLTTVDGQPDRWSALRPVVGYGPEMFETAYRLQLDVKVGVYALGQRVDRAHNDWLDTLMTTGWLGLAARLSFWLALFGFGLRRAGYRLHPLWLLLPLGMGLAAAFRAYSLAPPVMSNLTSSYANTMTAAQIDLVKLTFIYPLVPLAGTFGALIGFWLLLTLAPTHRTPSAPAARLILALLTVHLVDLQFGFTTVATAWPAMLAAGWLLSARPVTVSAFAAPTRSQLWSLSAAAGMFLIRFLIAQQAQPIGIAVLLIGLLALPSLLAGAPLRPPWTVAVAWAFGLAGAFLSQPLLAAVWDVAALLVSLALFGIVQIDWRNSGASACRLAAPLIVVAAVLFLWTRDTAADITLKQAQQEAPEQKAADSLAALSLRPWDERLYAEAGQALVSYSLSDAPRVRPDALREGYGLLQQAAQLQPYSADDALELAEADANLALLGQDAEDHLNDAEQHFAAASRLWPFEVGVWREWGLFELNVRHQPAEAVARFEQAQKLDQDNAEVKTLLLQAQNAAQGG